MRSCHPSIPEGRVRVPSGPSRPEGLSEKMIRFFIYYKFPSTFNPAQKEAIRKNGQPLHPARCASFV
jgi:hypothetical protein